MVWILSCFPAMDRLLHQKLDTFGGDRISWAVKSYLGFQTRAVHLALVTAKRF